MTPLESIYEIRSAVIELRKYLNSKERVVSKRAQMLYQQLVDRFFRENESFIKPDQRFPCLDDPDLFLQIMDSAVAYYYENQQY